MTSSHPPDPELLLGRYRIVKLLGEGGMGTVYLARVEGAEGFRRPVVVKSIKEDILSDERAEHMFRREAETLSKMRHPSILSIVDYGIENASTYMVLEYVHGYTLDNWLEYRAQREAIPIDFCIYLIRQVLAALHHAHRFETEDGQEFSVMHRDVSPDNVLISTSGTVKLLDFGIASVRSAERRQSTQQGSFRGKLGYAPPEAVMGQEISPASDQYSAAILLLQLLTGKVPFIGGPLAEAFDKMVHEMPEAPSRRRPAIHPGLDSAILRALAKDPAHRFASAHEFSRALRQFQTDNDEEILQNLKKTIKADYRDMPEQIGVESLQHRQRLLNESLPSGIPKIRFGSIAPAPPSRRELGATMDAAMQTPDFLVHQGRSRADDPGATLQGGAVPPTQLTDAAPDPNALILKRLIIALLVVGGLIAVILGLTVALLLRRGPLLAADRGRVEVPTNAPVPPSQVPVAPPSAPEPAALEKPSSPLESFVARVQARHGDFRSCFGRHAQAQGSSAVTLQFSGEPGKEHPAVVAKPENVAQTELGTCLTQVGLSVELPTLEEKIEFSIPLEASIASR